MNSFFSLSPTFRAELQKVYSLLKDGDNSNTATAIEIINECESVAKLIKEYSLSAILIDIKKTLSFLDRQKIDNSDNLILCAEISENVCNSISFLQSHYDYKDSVFANDSKNLVKMRGGSVKKSGYFLLSSDQIALAEKLPDSVSTIQDEGLTVEAANFALKKIETLYEGLEKSQDRDSIKELHKTLSGLKKYVRTGLEYNYYWLIQCLLETVSNSLDDDRDYLLSIIRLKNTITGTINNESLFKISDINNVLSIILFQKKLSKGFVKYAEHYGINDDFVKQYKQVQQGSKGFMAKHLGVVDAVKEEIGVISIITKNGSIDTAKRRVDALRQILDITGYKTESLMLEKSLSTNDDTWVECILSIENSFIRTGKPSIYIGSKFVNQETAEALLNEVDTEVNKLRLSSKKQSLTHAKMLDALYKIERVATTSLLTTIQHHASKLLHYSTKCDYQKQGDVYMIVEGIVCLQKITASQRMGIDPSLPTIEASNRVEVFFDSMAVIEPFMVPTESDDVETVSSEAIIPQEFKDLLDAFNVCETLLGYGSNVHVEEIKNYLISRIEDNSTEFESVELDEINIQNLNALSKEIIVKDSEVPASTLPCPIDDEELYEIAKKEINQRLSTVRTDIDNMCLTQDSHRSIHSIRGVLRHLSFRQTADDLAYYEDLLLEKGTISLDGLTAGFMKETLTSIDNAVNLVATESSMVKSVLDNIDNFKRKIDKSSPPTKLISKTESSSEIPVVKNLPVNPVDNNCDIESYIAESSSVTPRLSSIERQLTQLTYTRELLDEIARGVHTLKGAANMLGISIIGEVFHLLEDYLDAVKMSVISIDSDVIIRIKEILYIVVQSEAELKNNLEVNFNRVAFTGVKNLLDNENYEINFSGLLEKTIQHKPNSNNEPITISDALSGIVKSRKINTIQLKDSSEFIRLPIPEVRKLMSLTTVSRTNSFQSLSDQNKGQASNIKRGMSGISNYLGELRELLKESNIVKEKDRYSAQDLAQYSSAEDLVGRMDSIISEVDGYADNLISTGNDITRNGSSVHSKLESAKRIIFEAAQVPFSSIKAQIQSLVVDTASRSGLKAKLVFNNEGDLIEKSLLLEMLPVISHMIRNSIDHGMETPEERLSLAKPEIGSVTLGISIKESMLSLKISDDGKGMSSDNIFSKALEKGIVQYDAELNEDQKLNLIFHPGFSTSTEITSTSGRGVGMNVVKEFVESKKGNIHIRTKSGRGTEFTVELPLSSQSSTVFVCGIGGVKVGIPKAQLAGHVTMTENSDVITVKGVHYPVIKLSDLLGMPSIVEDDQVLSSVLVIKGATASFGISFEQSIGMQDVYIKPLTSVVDGVNGVADYNDKEVLSVIDAEKLFKKHMEHDGTSYRIIEKFIRSNSSEYTLSALVVDDSALMRNELSKMLSMNDFESICATDGVDALNLIERSGYNFNLITLDVEMPNLDGLSLLKRLKSSSKTQNIPVIMISSRASKSHIDRAKSLGASEFLVKPVSQAQLDNVISRYRS